MIAQPTRDRAPEPRIVERQHPPRRRRPFGPDDRRQIGRPARLGIGACRHRQLRERTPRKEVLQRDVVMRALMGDGGDDAGLRYGSRVTGISAASRNGEFRPSAATTRRQAISGPPATCTVAPASVRSTAASAGAKTDNADSVAKCAFSATRNTRASTMKPNGPASVAGLAMIEMQEQPRGRAAQLAVAHPDVENRTGGSVEALPQSGLHPAGGGNRRRWRRRGRRTPDAPSAAAARGRSPPS